MIKKKKELKVEIVRSCDVLAGQAYPYLLADWDWEIHNIPFDLLSEEEARGEQTRTVYIVILFD